MAILRKAVIPFVVFCAVCSAACAADLGHYSPASNGVRDYVMSAQTGFSLSVDNTYYSSDDFRGPGGSKFDSLVAAGSATKYIDIKEQPIPVTVSGNASADFSFKSRQFSQTFDLTWVPGIKILGADYAFSLSPKWGDAFFEATAKADANCTVSIGGISKTINAGVSEKFKEEHMGFGDLYVQPLWLAWRDMHYDVGLSYGFYAPTGYYHKDGMANIGLGYWTQQLQANFYWYPGANQATVFLLRPTYEWNSRKLHEDFCPGQSMTFEYGVSQYILSRAEIALLGYNQLQLTGQRGSASTDKSALSYTAGIGALLNYWLLKDKCSAAVKFGQEYATKLNFRGYTWSLNLDWIF